MCSLCSIMRDASRRPRAAAAECRFDVIYNTTFRSNCTRWEYRRNQRGCFWRILPPPEWLSQQGVAFIALRSRVRFPHAAKREWLCHSLCSWHRESDPGPPHYQCDALPTEPCQHLLKFHAFRAPETPPQTQNGLYHRGQHLASG